MRSLAIVMSLCAASVVTALLALPVASGGSSELGDANCDGSVDARDALLVLQLHAGLIEEVCGEVDVNGDGEVNSIDALFLLYFRLDPLYPLTPAPTAPAPTPTPLVPAAGSLAPTSFS